MIYLFSINNSYKHFYYLDTNKYLYISDSTHYEVTVDIQNDDISTKIISNMIYELPNPRVNINDVNDDVLIKILNEAVEIKIFENI